MSFDYTGSAETALRLLERFGRKVYLRRASTGEYDPGAGKAPQRAVDHEGIGAFFDYAQRDIDGTVIRVGDQRVLMAPNVPEPKTGDAVVVPPVDAPEAVWTVVQAKKVAPAGVPVLYVVQVRQ